MARDTFDRFQPNERGRFGDNELRRENEVERLERVSVTLVWRMDKGLASAFSLEPGLNQKWIWLPQSQITVINIQTGSIAYRKVTMPPWLAKQKGLS